MENNLLTFRSEINGWDSGLQLGFEPHQSLSIPDSELGITGFLLN